MPHGSQVIGKQDDPERWGRSPQGRPLQAWWANAPPGRRLLPGALFISDLHFSASLRSSSFNSGIREREEMPGDPGFKCCTSVSNRSLKSLSFEAEWSFSWPASNGVMNNVSRVVQRLHVPRVWRHCVHQRNQRDGCDCDWRPTLGTSVPCAGIIWAPFFRLLNKVWMAI